MSDEQLGPYVLEHCIGDGGMGRVHKGLHRESGEPVAIKILHQELSHDPEMVERFLREGRAASRVDHPGVVKILDTGVTDKGLPYLVMEYLQGQSLATHLRERGRLPLWEAMRITQELAAALAAAHARQVIHRDLKPENVFRLSDVAAPSWPHVKLLDFGIALIDTPSETLSQTPGEKAKRLTRAGEFLGTPCYMAPEVVIDPRSASERSDVYSLGVLLYEMLVGEPPFTADCPSGILFKQVSAPPPPLEKSCLDAPPLLCALVLELLAKQPETRPTMIEVFQALLYIERTLPSATKLSKSLRGGWVRRSIAWIAPSVFVCAGAMALTREPPRAPLPEPVHSQPLAPQPAPIAAPAVAAPPVAVETPLALTTEPQIPRWPGLPPMRLATDLPIEPPTPPTPPTRPRPVEPDVAPRPTGAPLMNEPPSAIALARQTFAQRQYEQTIIHAQKAVREKPYEAWQLLARAACKKGDYSLAKQAARRLDPDHQALVRFDCAGKLDD